jgi:hypothetical protein
MEQTNFTNSVIQIANRNNGRVIYCDEWVGTFGQWSPLLKQVPHEIDTSNMTILGEIEPVKYNHPDLYTFYLEIEIDKPNQERKERKELILARDESGNGHKFGAIIEVYN